MNRMGQKSRFGVLILLLLALGLHGAIPAGFMPEQGGRGLMRLAICTGAGHADVWVDAEKYSPVPHDVPHGVPHDRNDTRKKQAQGDICPFAPVLAQDAPAETAPAVPVFIHADAGHIQMAAGLVSGASPKPWFAQGPPVS